MSTILETLKKLEEDKRLLAKNLDLKELVLQEDKKRSAAILKTPSKKFMALGLILTGVLIGLAFKSPAKNEGTHFPQATPAQKIPNPNKKQSAVTAGIPLSHIAEYRPRYEETIDENFFQPVVMETFAPPATDIPAALAMQPEAQEVNEVRDLIQAAKFAAEQPEPFTYPSVSTGVSIPQLKIKGIIFFSPQSASNHIFVATSESSNRKVRVGDTVQSATLMHIESNRVVFAYQGKNVHLRIGE
jgi:hypothetical protein